MGGGAWGRRRGDDAKSMQACAEEEILASDRLRRVFLELARRGAKLFIQNRKMHDIVAAALAENWHSCEEHDMTILSVIRRIVQEGRESGEFERKTPLDETSRAILLAMETIKNPSLLELRLDSLEAESAALSNFVLRSLSP